MNKIKSILNKLIQGDTIPTRNELKEILGGDEIRKQRMELCYTQEYMANKLGISQSTYQKIESGSTKLSMDRIFEILSIFEHQYQGNLNLEKFEEMKEKIERQEVLIIDLKTQLNNMEKELNDLKCKRPN